MMASIFPVVLCFFFLFMEPSIKIHCLIVPSKPTPLIGDLIEYKGKSIPLPSVTGPESLDFDGNGLGPYTGVSDGRIFRWNGHSRGWAEFAFPLPNRNRTLCDGNVAIDVEELCGRPLGLQFHRRTGKLYIADAYLGLLVVGRSGGLAKQVATAAEGQPFLFTNGVDVDQKTGIVYFTDTSSLFHRRDWMRVMVMADATGRFLKYNPSTGKTTVLLRGLMFPNGVALSKDGKFALIVETTTKRVILYWLKGPNKGQVRTFAQLLWTPDNIRTTSQGDFWVAVSSPGSDVIGVKMDFQGRHTALLWRTSMNDTVSEVKDHRGRLWLGSVESSSVSLSTI